MSACRSCGAEVRWVTMDSSGSAMPLDPEPDSDRGTVYVTSAGGRAIGRAMKADELALARKGDAPLFVSHFATCPDASKHRKAAA